MALSVRWAPLGPEHYEFLHSLAGRCFPVPEEASFFQDFPIWDLRVNANKFQWGGFAGEKLVCSASLRFGNLKPSGRKVAILGAVMTLEEMRGSGLGSALIEEAIRIARERGVESIYLWGSEKNLYGRFGFVDAGEQLRIPLGAFPVEGAPRVPIRHGWDADIFHFIKHRPTGLTLAESDHDWVARHKNVKWLSTHAPDGTLRAFAAIGRGIDLTNLVHEWGGEESALLSLFHEIYRETPEAELLYHPSHAEIYGFLRGDLRPIREIQFMVKDLTDEKKIHSDEWFAGMDSC